LEAIQSNTPTTSKHELQETKKHAGRYESLWPSNFIPESTKTWMMETSRIFVRNLPPALNEADFRKHFALKGRDITDAKLIAPRRIGYVGYATHEDAVEAVRHFNRSFIRMSKIAVELARPVS
jgi:RNA recognition motif-containing protein